MGSCCTRYMWWVDLGRLLAPTQLRSRSAPQQDGGGEKMMKNFVGQGRVITHR